MADHFRFPLAPLSCALLLAACSGNEEPPPVAVGLEHIDCAVGGSAELKPACSVERIEKDDGLTLVVHHPDGAFRSFRVTDDGKGLSGPPGARIRLVDQRLDVTVGADRYLFPATVKPDAAQ